LAKDLRECCECESAIIDVVLPEVLATYSQQ